LAGSAAFIVKGAAVVALKQMDSVRFLSTSEEIFIEQMIRVSNLL
jgi:hypothetical protein